MFGLYFLDVSEVDLQQPETPGSWGRYARHGISSSPLVESELDGTGHAVVELLAPVYCDSSYVVTREMAFAESESLRLITLLLAGKLAAVATHLLLVMRDERQVNRRLETLVASGAAVLPGQRDDHGRHGSGSQPVALEVGAQAPDFHLPTLAGREVSMAEIRPTWQSAALICTDPICDPARSYCANSPPEWMPTRVGPICWS